MATITQTLSGVTTSVNYFVEGVTGGLDIHTLPDPAGFVRNPLATYVVSFQTTGHAFLNDIAHAAAPGNFDRDHIPRSGDEVPQLADTDSVLGITTIANPNYNPAFIGQETFLLERTPQVAANPNFNVLNPPSNTNAAFLPARAFYDNELLDSHFITGDGRGNENIGLTTVHTIFHAEHNRLVDANKATLFDFANAPGTAVEKAEHLAFLNEWLIDKITVLPADASTLVWDGERLFQAAKFVTEMQYQHLVFEEFARKVQPNVNAFVFTNSPDIDPAITAEFAHVVYRFGHSMLTDTVSRLDGNMTQSDISLFDAFLNPQAFDNSATAGGGAREAAANIIRGMVRQTGNEIDEFVVNDLRNRLVGLPLDLPALNIARGRSEGIPSFNDARAKFYADTNDASLKPYTSWLDYAENLKNPLTIVNFIAAYGLHSTITSQSTIEGKRHAAELLVLGDPALVAGSPEKTAFDNDRFAFLNSTGTYASGANGRPITGLNDVDLWIGGLAEAKFEFGGFLGSTFNYVFERQLENLQNGDRFYYLSRLQGLNLLNELEPNTFAALVQRNTTLGDEDSSHLPGLLFDTVDATYELNQSKQIGADPVAASAIVQLIRPPLVRHAPGADVNGDGKADGGYLKFLGGEHVVLGGTAGNDELRSDKGIDTLWGDAGDDYLNAGSETDNVFGGDGDDIIEDPFGDDFLRGDEGNDVIVTGQGLKLLFGGGGQDFIVAGVDVTEVFAGRDNDFVLGGSGADTLSGNEGDDWIEGGEGFDGISGENSQLFFNSTIVGHDVLNGQGNDTDYDAEAGDDIMVQSAGIQRNNGMDGFDWAIHKGDTVAANSDLGIPIFVTRPDLILRDRFDSVEGLSGWKFNDVLTGAAKLVLGENFDNRLTQEGVDRINGLQTIVGGVHNADPRFVAFGLRAFDGSEIILGGDGSDTITGNLGNDILDGDAWLNVRIAVHANKDGTGAVIGTAESMTSKVFASIGADGIPVGPALFGGKSLQAGMLDRTFNPGQLSIVREILYDTTPGNDTDVAVFSDVQANYTIVRNGTNVTVTHNPVAGGVLVNDGTDILRHIEIARFTDGDLFIGNRAPTGVPTITGTENVLTANIAGIADANGLPGPAGFNYVWQSSVDGSIDWTPFAGATSQTFTVPAGNLNFFRVIVSYLDGGGFNESITSRITARVGRTAVNDTLDGTADPNLLNGRSGNDILSGFGGNDVLNGSAGTDTLNGGADNDTLNGGTGNDIVNGDAGLDTITYTMGDGADTVDGGADADTLAITGTGASETLDVVYNGTAITSSEGGSVTSIESVTANLLGGGNDRLSYTGTTVGVTVDFAAGTASGFTTISNIENATGGSGNDVFTGTAAVGNAFDGGAGTGDRAVYTNPVTNFSFAPNGGSLDVTRAGVTDTLTSIEQLQFAANNFALVQGTNAAQTLTGGAGADLLLGFGGNDTINANGGDDAIVWGVGDGRDIVNGGLGGTDTFVVNGNNAAETYRVYARANAIAAGITGLAANTDIVITRNGTNNASVLAELDEIEEIVINTGGGADTVLAIGSFAPTNLNFNTITINDSSSNDTVDLSQLTSAHHVVLHTTGTGGRIIGARPQDQIIVDGGGGSGSVDNANAMYGTASADNMAGTQGDDQIDSLAGNDRVSAGAGQDSITGGAGADRLDGEAGDDTFVATINDGNDRYDGGTGNDTYDLSATSAAATVNLVKGSASSTQTGLDRLTSIENVTGSSGNNTITGSAVANVLSGGGGNDTISAGAGDDVVTGGTGNDTLTGGAGNDRFVYAAGFGNDRITDFDAGPSAGQDLIDLSQLGITSSTFADHVTIANVGFDTLITIDNNAALTIRLVGIGNATTVTESDFLLFSV